MHRESDLAHDQSPNNNRLTSHVSFKMDESNVRLSVQGLEMTKKMHLFKSSNQLLTDKTKKLSGDKAQKKASAPKTQDKAMSSVVDEDLIT